MQNLDLPHFGREQSGNTYYFSSLIICGFGVVDYSIEELNAYIYTEAEGKKGGNNVVSLLSHSLKKKGFLEMQKTWNLENHLLWFLTIVAGKTKTT